MQNLSNSNKKIIIEYNEYNTIRREYFIISESEREVFSKNLN